MGSTPERQFPHLTNEQKVEFLKSAVLGGAPFVAPDGRQLTDGRREETLSPLHLSCIQGLISCGEQPLSPSLTRLNHLIQSKNKIGMKAVELEPAVLGMGLALTFGADQFKVASTDTVTAPAIGGGVSRGPRTV